MAISSITVDLNPPETIDKVNAIISALNALAGGGAITSGTAAPTTGTWAVGDRCFNTAPAAGGYIGWVCTTAGTPGTWKGYGAIAA